MGVLDGVGNKQVIDWAAEKISTLVDTHETEIVAIQGVNTASVGTAGTGVTAAENGYGNFKSTVLTLTDAVVTVADAAGTIGYGSLKVYDFPTGYIYTVSAVTDLVTTLSAAGIDADWEGDFGLGTAACAGDADLTSTEDDILLKTAIPAATTSVGTLDGASAAAEHVIFDGTSTAKDLYVNILVDDADHDVTSTPTNIILNGTITLNWIFMGDN